MDTYEITTGNRRLSLVEAPNARQALVDYTRSLGCKDEEIMNLGADAVSWRGAVYKARPTADSRPVRRR